MADAVLEPIMECWTAAEMKRPYVVSRLTADMEQQIQVAYLDRLRQLLLPVRNLIAGELAADDAQHMNAIQLLLLKFSNAPAPRVPVGDTLPTLIRGFESALSLRWVRLQIRPATDVRMVYTVIFCLNGYPQDAAHSLLVDKWPMLAVVLLLTGTPIAPEKRKQKKAAPPDPAATDKKPKKARANIARDCDAIPAEAYWVTRISDEVSLSGRKQWSWPSTPRCVQLLGMAWCPDGPAIRRPVTPKVWTPEDLILFEPTLQ